MPTHNKKPTGKDLRKKGYLLHDVPIYERTYDLCKIAAKSDGICLRSIPSGILNDELVRLCVASYGTALLEAPSEYWNDYLLCLKSFCCAQTFRCFYNRYDNEDRHNNTKCIIKYESDLILTNAISIYPALRVLIDLRVAPNSAAETVKSFFAERDISINTELPVLD